MFGYFIIFVIVIALGILGLIYASETIMYNKGICKKCGGVIHHIACNNNCRNMQCQKCGDEFWMRFKKPLGRRDDY